jgi:phage baseplate assembly protein W
MARQIYSYKPIDNIKDKALGVLLPFNKFAGGSKSISSNYKSQAGSGNGVFESSYTTEQQAVSNFKNLLLTGKGERYMQPTFGTNIRKSLFENNTTDLEVMLEESLQNDIAFWLPYITITEFEVRRRTDQHQFLIKIQFQATEDGANQQIVILASGDNLVVGETNGEY